MKKQPNNKLIIYKNEAGKIEIDVKFEKENIWLSLIQISKLYGRDKSVISRHISEIFKTKELNKKSTVAKNATVQREGERQVKRNIDYYNLDMIISIGYRVNSKRATQFRIWATKTLRHYLIEGYAVNEKRLIEEKAKFKRLENAIEFIEKKSENYLLKDKSKELFSLLGDYTKALKLLRGYDEDKIKIARKSKPKFVLGYEDSKEIIKNAKQEQEINQQDLFGSEYKNKLKSIIGAINQTFDGTELYESIEEKAANLFYLVIKDHPFADGNKRIASILFLYYLERNNFLYKKHEKKVNNTAIVALALLVAVSDPKDKEVLVKIIMSLLQ